MNVGEKAKVSRLAGVERQLVEQVNFIKVIDSFSQINVRRAHFVMSLSQSYSFIVEPPTGFSLAICVVFFNGKYNCLSSFCAFYQTLTNVLHIIEKKLAT